MPGSEFEIELDTLILAISQHPVLDLFGERPPELTPGGFIAVDPATFEDVNSRRLCRGRRRRGGACVDRQGGRRRQARRGGHRREACGVAVSRPAMDPTAKRAPADLQELVVRRARREYRVPIRVTSLDRRAGFEETVLGYTVEEAVREAGRCLDCDRVCSLCVGVCPNMALMTYEMTPVQADLRILSVAAGAVVERGSTPFVAGQPLQIAVLTDLCNECGNCVTACPTSGRPFVDKPRLYLDRADFEAQASNAFMLVGDGVIEAQFEGATHRLAAPHPGDGDSRIAYVAPGFRALLDRDTFAVLEATPTAAADGETLSLGPAAVMATILAGVTGSLPHIPTARPGGTRVAAPGFTV